MRRWGTALLVGALFIAVADVPAGAGQGNAKKFCRASRAVDVAFAADQPNVRTVNRLLDVLAKTAPPGVSDAVDVAVPAFKENPETAFEDPAVAGAVGEIEAFEYENCGYEQLEVSMVDYAFEGLPSEIDKGMTAFRLSNTGTEAHEMFVVKLKGDTTVEDLLAAEESEFDSLAQEVGGGFALPGQDGYATVNFKRPGRYAAVCFIPVGTTSETTEGTGPPHATQGMATEFAVS
jgi:hypothetical protein